ncbi:MAG: hypothetical protein ACI8XM_002737 [Haloarculaceae archaeon]
MTVPERVWEERLDEEDGVGALRSLHDAGGIDIVTVEDLFRFVGSLSFGLFLFQKCPDFTEKGNDPL